MYFKHLGCGKNRARWLIELGKDWLAKPPTANKIWPKSNKPAISEAAHLPGIGRDSSDVWRILCKDKLYSEAGYPPTTPEWMYVVPKNRKLKEYLSDKWAKEGYHWDPETGNRHRKNCECVVKTK
jgi:hypothetical protein